MKYWLSLLLLALTVCLYNPTYAQEISPEQLAGMNIDQISDEQLSAYWIQAKAQGYTMQELESLAAMKGVSALDIAKLKQRINALSMTDKGSNATPVDDTSRALEINTTSEGLTGKELVYEKKQSSLFGYDFFNNDNISFTPNLNLATPKTYLVGPGDELLIDIWGASENSYRKQVDRRGAIVIENVGPVYVGGLQIDQAKQKIVAYLKKIYSGIAAPSDSFNKVHTEISLVGFRTVQVNIIGEVKVPGTYALSALSSVLNGLYAAGGPTEKGSFRNVRLIRNGKEVSNFDIYNYLINGSQEGNDFLQDKDVLIVPPYQSKISITGRVKRPGVFELKEGETIQELLAFASGFTSDAYKELLMVDRIYGSQKKVHEIDLAKEPKYLLQDGDQINVQGITNRYLNRVSVTGAVFRPGTYELEHTPTLKDLIEKADGLTPEAYLERGVVYRVIDDVDKEVLSFSLKEVMEGAKNITLQREDRVQVYSRNSLKETFNISIDGAVNNPLSIGHRNNITVEDFILMAGGFKEGADPKQIEISRKVVDSNFVTLRKIIPYSTSLKLDQKSEFYLEPFDLVSVRYKKGYHSGISASVQGEVEYPGNYSLSTKEERISDLLAKTGGFTPYAYAEGATLIRRANNASEKEQLKLLQELIVRDSSLVKVTTKNTYMVGIDLAHILGKGKKTEADLILEQGDVLVIPSKKQTIAVQGEVMVPSLIRFQKGMSMKDYIRGSGGFSEDAKKKKVYVVYANGDVKNTRHFLWWKFYPDAEPGAIVLVPKKEPKNKLKLSEFVGISSALLSLALLVQNLTK